MEKKLFSVIIPIYNVEKYLDQCIQSVLSQTYRNFELILVNDGSLDNCFQICEKYKKEDTRIKVIHKKNGGSVSARQTGIEIALGKYIVCIDGDDWISLDYLEKLKEMIERNNYPDIVCVGQILAYENKKMNVLNAFDEIGYFNKNKIEKEIFPKLIENNEGKYFNYNLCGKAIKKELCYFNHSKVFKGISFGDDAACVKPCIYQANSMFVTKECLYYYRQNFNSMTKVLKPIPWNKAKELGEFFQKVIPMNEKDFIEQSYRSTVHFLFNTVESQFNQNKNYKKIKVEIDKNLDECFYQNAIKNCKYKKFTKGYYAHYSLKKRIYFMIYLYNKLKKIKNYILFNFNRGKN